MGHVAVHPRHREHPRPDGASAGPVIACVGDGPAAVATARVAASLARMLEARLMTVCVEQPGERISPAPATVARTAGALDLHAEPHLVLGEPAEQLTIVADHQAARLLVVAAPDPSAPAPPALGAVYLALAGAGAWPVVVVPPRVRSPAPGGPIVCGVDGSGQSLIAARVAARLADSADAELLLVKAIDPRERGGRDFDAITTVRRIAASQRLRRAAPRSPVAPATRLLVQEGPAVDLLAATARRESALLLAVGSCGHGNAASVLLGSVASALATTATTPVLIVPPRAARSQGMPSQSLPGRRCSSRSLRTPYA